MAFKNVFEFWLKEKAFYDLNDLTLLPKSSGCEQFQILSEMIWTEQTCNNLSPWNASTTLKSLNNEMTQIKIVHSTVPLNYLASCYSIQTVWFPQWPLPSHLFNCNKIRKEVKVSTANRLTGRSNHLFVTFTLCFIDIFWHLSELRPL